MPIYEYRCEQGHTFEVLQRISDDPVTSCQTCEAPVERVYHPVAVHFKGSGFYNTDYGTRKRAREKAEAGEGSSSTGTDSGSTTSTDSSSSGSETKSSDAKSSSSKGSDSKAASSSTKD